jgi:hypothetical protein
VRLCGHQGRPFGCLLLSGVTGVIINAALSILRNALMETEMNWYQVALWTMIFLKSGAFLVFVWWWMFKRATKPYVRPQDVVVDDKPYDENLTMEEVMKKHGITRAENSVQ